MKTFGKVILGIIVVFMGVIVFNYVNSVAVHKSVGYQGDKAYLDNDLSFFKNRFEYHKEEPLLHEEISFLVSDEYIIDNELELTEKEVSLEFYIFHSANVSKDKGNYLTILVKDLVLPEGIKEEKYLDLYFKYDAYQPKAEEAFNIVKIGKENWYLQWIKVTFDNINSIELKHGSLSLYEYDLDVPLLKAENHDLMHLVNKKDESYNILRKISEEVFPMSTPERSGSLKAEVDYEIFFNVRLAFDVAYKEDLYLSGEFNDWALADEEYKLKKNSSGIYTTKISFKSNYDEVYYAITTTDGFVGVNEEGNIDYLSYLFIKTDQEISDYNIVKSYIIKFDDYEYYKWITMGVYVGILLLTAGSVFGVTMYKNKKRRENRAIKAYEDKNPSPKVEETEQ